MNLRCRASIVVVSIMAFLSACGGGGDSTAGAAFLAPNSTSATTQLSVAPAGTFVPQGSSDWPLFVYPQPGDPHVDVTQPVKWTAANNARGYELQIGTTLGGSDVFDSGVITTTSVAMPPLPAGVVLYARVRAVLNGWADAVPSGHWPRGSYTRFRTDDQTEASTITNVTSNGALAAGTPLEWNASPLAVGYQLKIETMSLPLGLTLGVEGVPSGVIHATHALIVTPFSATVTVTLDTIYLTRTVSSQLTFVLTGGTLSFEERYQLAKELTGDVRSMADRDNQPYGLTALDAIVNRLGFSAADCGDFETTLLQLIGESNVGLNARPLDVELEVFDTHTLVEVLDNLSDRWVTLDPTFGLITLDSNGLPATSAEISTAARDQNWPALTFEYLTPAGTLYTNDYYIDYPLLFIDIELPDGSGLVQGPPTTLAPYFDALPLPVSGAQSAYALQCAPGFDSATAQLNAMTQTMPCIGPDRLTGISWAYTIQPISGNASAAAAWQLRRFVF